MAKVEKTLIAPKVPVKQTRERAKQVDLPPSIQSVWSTVFVPTLRAYAGTFSSGNPFVLDDPLETIRFVFRNVYPRKLYQDHKDDIVPKRPIYDLVRTSVLFNGHINLHWAGY
jgi:hypothetical protein